MKTTVSRDQRTAVFDALLRVLQTEMPANYGDGPVRYAERLTKEVVRVLEKRPHRKPDEAA